MSLIPTAYAATATATSVSGAPHNPVMSTITMLLIFGLFIWFFMWRPQTKRAKQHRELMSSLQSGDEVVTNGGIYGKLSLIEETFVNLKIADNTEIRLLKSSIANVIPKGTLKL